MARARIRHLAIKSPNPERLGNFYQEAFGMDVIHRSKNGGVYLSDGYLTLALLKCRPEDTPPGINHFGFEVEDSELVGRKLVEAGLPAPTQRPQTTPYAEIRGMDLDGNLFDISEHGYAAVEYPPERGAKAPRSKEKV
jgi:catechol 2,3-dioxygenase-like lactoylglutathione lyase family enzyme